MFTELFREQSGSTPTWGARQGAQIKQLLSAHGADEVQARMRRLFGGAIASWCRPPYDLSTLVLHADKLAAVLVSHGDPERRSRRL